MIYGYARVSTDAQDLAIQLELLKSCRVRKGYFTTRRLETALIGPSSSA